MCSGTSTTGPFLADFYAAKKKRGFSFRAFSRAASLGAPNYLKLVISGDRNLTAEMAERFATRVAYKTTQPTVDASQAREVGPGTVVAEPADDAAHVFDQQLVHTFDITIAAADLETVNASLAVQPWRSKISA